MIVNISKIKTEALLLFCRDLIDSYKNSDLKLFDIDDKLAQFVKDQTLQLYKAINVVVQDSDYYTRNIKVSRIKMIIKGYNFINKTIEKRLKQNSRFNPSMLCFALLSTWFLELDKEDRSKEYIYFTLYPYSDIFDKLLLNVDIAEYKKLNIAMLNIAEDTVFKLNNYRFN